MYDVITVGSATVDAFAYTTRTGRILIETLERKDDFIFYPSGEKLLINQLEFSVGGGGTNTAVAMSRLGLKVAFLGKIGKGTNAKYIMRNLKEEKVSTDLVISKDSRTGYSIILDAQGKDRTILAFKGSNSELKWSEVKKNKLKAKWFYFSSMLDESLKTQIQIAKYAEKEKIKIMYNPSGYQCRQGEKLIRDILIRAEILILNKEEAEQLLEIKNNHQNPHHLAKELLKLGPKNVIITDGKRGAYALYEDKFYTIKPRNVKIIEATGAGDAFASTLLTGIIKKMPFKKAAQIAVVNAQSVIQHHGAKNILLDMRTALKKVREHTPKVMIGKA